jgi:putative ABC transport system permease protein
VIDGLRGDLRFALRSLSARPILAVTVVATLAVAIGAGTSLFSVVNGVLLRPLPYPAPESLYGVLGIDTVNGVDDANMSHPDVVDLRGATTLAGLAAYSTSSGLLAEGREPAIVTVGLATAGFFETLGARAAVGRLFTTDEEKVGRHRVLLLSDALWRRNFGADPQVAGKTTSLYGLDYTVVGVLPAGFTGPQPQIFDTPDLWRPVPFDSDSRGGHWLRAIARLRDGATPAQAQAELDTLGAALEKDHPDTNTGRQVRLVPLRETIVSQSRPALAALMGAVFVLVLIACANVAGLLLARAHERRREAAVRSALGAGRARLVRLVLTESLVLSLAGGAAGTLLALWGTDVILSLAGRSIPRADQIALDAPTLLFAALLSIGAGLLFGLAPALRLSSGDLSPTLKSGPGATVAGGGRRMREALVVAQMALSLVLLIGAGLLLGSLDRLLRVPPGFRTEGVVTMGVDLPRSRYGDDAKIMAFYDALLERLAALPGVSAVGGVNIAPLTGANSCDSFSIKEHPPIAPGQEPCAEARVSTPGYFHALGIPIRQGRWLEPRDAATSPPVALVNEAFARRFLPGEEPLGRHIEAGGAVREIVGVVGDVRHFGLGSEAPPEYYMPHTQVPGAGLLIVARAGGDAAGIAPAVRAAVRELDAGLVPGRAITMEEILAGSVRQPRFRAVLLASLAASALLLAVVGLYGLMAYTVGQRLPEIGIRMALGAGRPQILNLILGRGLALVAAGLSLGLLGAALLTPLLSGLLFGVRAGDPATYAGLSAILAGAALLACLVPALRAARVEPMRVLRSE